MFEFLVKMHLTHVILLSLIGCIYGMPNPEEYVVVRNSLKPRKHHAPRRDDSDILYDYAGKQIIVISTLPHLPLLHNGVPPKQMVYPMGQMGQLDAVPIPRHSDVILLRSDDGPVFDRQLRLIGTYGSFNVFEMLSHAGEKRNTKLKKRIRGYTRQIGFGPMEMGQMGMAQVGLGELVEMMQNGEFAEVAELSRDLGLMGGGESSFPPIDMGIPQAGEMGQLGNMVQMRGLEQLEEMEQLGQMRQMGLPGLLA